MRSLTIGVILSTVLISGCGPAASEFAPIPVTHSELQSEIDARTGQVVVVNFWATWCAPCVKEFPEFIKFGKEFEDKGVDIMFVSADFETDLQLANEFLKEHDVPWKTYWKTGKEHEFITAMHNEWSGALPTTFVYGRDGSLLTMWEGIMPYEELERQVTSALGT